MKNMTGSKLFIRKRKAKETWGNMVSRIKMQNCMIPEIFGHIYSESDNTDKVAPHMGCVD